MGRAGSECSSQGQATPWGQQGASFYLPPESGLGQAWLMGLCPVPQVEEEKRKKKEEAARRKQEQEVLHVSVGRGPLGRNWDSHAMPRPLCLLGPCQAPCLPPSTSGAHGEAGRPGCERAAEGLPCDWLRSWVASVRTMSHRCEAHVCS